MLTGGIPTESHPFFFTALNIKNGGGGGGAAHFCRLHPTSSRSKSSKLISQNGPIPSTTITCVWNPLGSIVLTDSINTSLADEVKALKNLEIRLICFQKHASIILLLHGSQELRLTLHQFHLLVSDWKTRWCT